ncbi:MAG: TGS domain-containing protein [Nitrososphaeria archaeon]
MVTNLPAKSKALWARAMLEKDPKVKLELLRQFYSSFPKHKSTEKLEMQLKRQMKSLEEEIERRKKKYGKVVNIWNIKKETDIQLAVIGKLNESIEYFSKVTKVRVDPFEAFARPIVGTIQSDSIPLQTILCPFDSQIGEIKQKKIANLLSNADLLIIILPENEHLKYLTEVIDWLSQNNITIKVFKKYVRIEATGTGGIRVVGKSKFCNESEIRKFLYEYKIINGIIKVSEETTLEDIESTIFGQTSKPGLILYWNSKQEIDVKNNYKSISLTPLKTEKQDLLKIILDILGLIRVYTKGRDTEVAERPILLKRGSQVIEAAKVIHKELAEDFLYAKLIRANEEFKVGKYFILNDGDIIEVRSK